MINTNIAIIGYGYWGKNLVRNFHNLSTCNLHTVVDSDSKQLEKVKQLYPSVNLSTSFEETIKNKEINGVVIATPVDQHYPLAKAALLAGKHVLVEKPLTDSAETARELVALAKKEGKLLMVDHTFLYTGAVRYLKIFIDSGALGNITYIDSTRINLGLFQHDINVLWDLAPHDISICNFLFNKKIISVSATGMDHTNRGIENIAYLTLKYENNLIAHFNCSWVAPVKIRQMLIGGDKKMIVFNDMEPTEKIKIYDSGYQITSIEDENSIKADYRTGDIFVPKISMTEALELMAQDFIAGITEQKVPDSNAMLGLQVVEVLDAAQQSLELNGQEVKL